METKYKKQNTYSPLLWSDAGVGWFTLYFAFFRLKNHDSINITIFI